MTINAVRTVRFSDGERFPVLLDRATGIPLFKPTIYAIAQVRARNRTSSTIGQVLRSIAVLFRFLDEHGIDLDSRLRDGKIFQLSEVDALVDYCRPRRARSVAPPVVVEAAALSPSSNIVSLAARRKIRAEPAEDLKPGTAAIRIRYIAAYLEWLKDERLLQLRHDDPVRAFLSEVGTLAINAIKARVPKNKGRNAQGKREGLSVEIKARLLEVIRPDSPENPWLSQKVRERNELLILCFLELGVRRGELLGLRVEDIDLRQNEIFIARRPDDPEDGRAQQPDAKTRDRIIPLSADLASRIRAYVLGTRRTYPKAKMHSFLFVANGKGKPLALSTVALVFKTLREKVPDLPDDLCPHQLRHTWNDDFSKTCDEKGIKPEREKRMRSYLMGWQDDSETAETYTRRTVREEAKKAHRVMQDKMVQGRVDDAMKRRQHNQAKGGVK